jgi:hypothetical protein
MEIATELYIARDKLNAQGQRTDITSGHLSQSWESQLGKIAQLHLGAILRGYRP